MRDRAYDKDGRIVKISFGAAGAPGAGCKRDLDGKRYVSSGRMVSTSRGV